MRVGGYILVDFGDLDITTGSTATTINGLYERITDAMISGKPIIAENLYYGSVSPMTPLHCCGWINAEGTIILTTSVAQIHITEANSVTTSNVVTVS